VKREKQKRRRGREKAKKKTKGGKEWILVWISVADQLS